MSDAARSVTLPEHREISTIIPHSGAMVLIDKVLFCDAKKLVASVTLSSNSPLAFNGTLGGESLLEYAGQCTALHGALSATNSANNPDCPSDSIDQGSYEDLPMARPAFISQTKAFQWCPELPNTCAEITVHLEGQTADGAIYRFCVIDSKPEQLHEQPHEQPKRPQQELASGTLSVIFSNIESSGH